MEIMIGRESGNSRLSVVVNNKQMFYGNAGSVPKSVSRQHCKITVDNAGEIVLENIKPENVTFVDGQEVTTKHITTNSKIELGASKYVLNIQAILASLTFPSPSKGKPTYSIRHLQKVWDEYHDALLQHQIKNGKQVAIQSITGVLSPLALVLALFPIDGIGQFRPILYVVMVVLGIIFCWSKYKSSTNNPLYLDKLNNEFHKNYVCPNSDCHVFLGNQPFDDLKKVGKCVHCQSILIDE